MSILNREHRYLSLRGQQIRLNRLSALGGRPYINERLERAANESDLSWLGTDDTGKKVCSGRRDRAAYVNDAARVCQKIEQYIFSQPILRVGADERFVLDVTGEGVGIDAFMQKVCREITTSGWCWVQVDRMAWDAAMGLSLAEKAERGDRVRWELWDANAVKDWHFDDDGTLGWILVESDVWTDANPLKEAEKAVIRTLFRKVDGVVTVTEFLVSGNAPYELKIDEPLTGLRHIPFVCVGLPSADPWWFDDVEAAQCQCLNLGSLHNETLVGSVFPQLVISETTISKLETKFRAEGKPGEETIRLIRELVRGRNHPIIECGEDKGSSRFIEPSGNGLKLIPEEQARIRSLMFENAGLSLFNRETKQVQTAESKQFDQLDTNATLSHRAALLQQAEARLVGLSKEFDAEFAPWVPQYPAKFDVFDAQGVSAVLQTVLNLPNVTPSMRKMALVSAIRLLQSIASFDKDLIDSAMKEIDAIEVAAEEEEVFVELPPTKFGEDETPEEDEEAEAENADDKKQAEPSRRGGQPSKDDEQDNHR